MSNVIPSLHEIEKRILAKSVQDHLFFREFYDRFGDYRFQTEVRNWIFRILKESKDGKDLNRLVLRRRKRKNYKVLSRIYKLYKSKRISAVGEELLKEFDVIVRTNSNLAKIKRYVESVKLGEYGRADSILNEGFVSVDKELFDETEVSEDVKEELDRLVGAETTDIVGKYGFGALDRSLGGIWAGEFVLLFGRSAVGKSIFLLNIAHNIRSDGMKMCLINLEMKNVHVKKRYFSRVSNLDYQKKIKQGHLKKKDRRRILSALKTSGMSGGKLYIVSVRDTCTIGMLQSIIRRYKVEKGVDIFGIDFLDCVHSGKRSYSEQHELGIVSRAIKDLAMIYNVGIIGITHQNFYNDEAEEDGILSQRDVGYSQRKVQFCDVALGILMSNRDKEEGTISFQTVKTRDSESNLMFKLRPDLNKMRFKEIT